MSPEPYSSGQFGNRLPYSQKTPVDGVLNCILNGRTDKRGLQLILNPSRAVLKGEIHELILTTEEGARPGNTVDQIAYLAFFEITQGGMIWSGDEVCVEGKVIGTLAGYDMTHFPNHMNIVVQVNPPLQTGEELGFPLGAQITFQPKAGH